MDPVPTTVEIDGEYYLNEYLKLKAENEKLREENKILKEIYDENAEYECPYYFSNNKMNEILDMYYDEIRPNFSHLRGITKARAMNKAGREFFKKESPELERWLKTNGYLK